MSVETDGSWMSLSIPASRRVGLSALIVLINFAENGENRMLAPASGFFAENNDHAYGDLIATKGSFCGVDENCPRPHKSGYECSVVVICTPGRSLRPPHSLC